MNRRNMFNAFKEAMIAELDDAAAQHIADPTSRQIVLAGTGQTLSPC